MDCSCCKPLTTIIAILVCFLVFDIITSSSPVNSTLREDLDKHRRVRAHLRRLNKLSLKTIQSPDGDLIDCVPSHLQPAFDHPRLKGQKPMHAVGYVSGDQYYGAKASLNVWTPTVTDPSEFSLSQIWVISGSFNGDLNTIEAGWQVSPQLYGDSYPRFFIYWTSDAYQETGCYNLLCSGFIQTNNKIAIGAAISPTSAYNAGQFDISLLIWKDPHHGHWWLEFGSGLPVGYWPSFLFNRLGEHASMIQFGGEIVDVQQAGVHTSTQMGSGHFAGDGFRKASYFRNLQVVDWDNNLVPLSNLRVLADHPNCYDIRGGVNRVWGNYFYYGGPGRNARCP